MATANRARSCEELQALVEESAWRVDGSPLELDLAFTGPRSLRLLAGRSITPPAARRRSDQDADKQLTPSGRGQR